MSIIDKLTVKPWLTVQAAGDEIEDSGGYDVANVKIGLWVFLGVVAATFSLFGSAYRMRMDLGDWQPLSEPALLWLNTGILVLGSVALQWAVGKARRGEMDAVKTGFIVAGGATFAFLVGQLIVWQQLADLGYFAVTNSSYAFFYLFTGVHGLHLLGGLVAWGRTVAKLWRGGFDADQVTLSVELCAIYWHFLLFVWLCLFALLLLT